MLMSSDDGGVDHRAFVVRIVSQRLEKILPHAALRPPREPRVNVLPVAEALGQIPPWRPQAEFPNHRLNEKAIAQFAIASDMSRTTRQQMFNPSTKRRLVWYTVDPPTPTLAAIASSLAPASAASRICARLSLRASCLPPAQKRPEFGALGMAELHSVAYIHLRLLGSRHGRTAELDGRRESACKNLHVQAGPVSGVHLRLYAAASPATDRSRHAALLPR
jgi:hypothetical protein